MRAHDISADLILQMQKDQYLHDQRNHGDILHLHKTERLKHYGLHFCKYVGRLARGAREAKSEQQTFTDALLVSLSAANTLSQRLTLQREEIGWISDRNAFVYALADATGRFADACEKIDHLVEDYLEIARVANLDIFQLMIDFGSERGYSHDDMLIERRTELDRRMFFR